MTVFIEEVDGLARVSDIVIGRCRVQSVSPKIGIEYISELVYNECVEIHLVVEMLVEGCSMNIGAIADFGN